MVNLIIDKSLYGLKTSAARFHEHLSETLLSLSFKKTKHDPDGWMVDKSSNYEYLATYVDDILIWSFRPIKIPMSEGYHPEIDDSTLCTKAKILLLNIHQSLVVAYG
jgi:hypothetical protein